jgi:nitrite reductase/ring-hydroxylating ferredoxin subunit
LEKMQPQEHDTGIRAEDLAPERPLPVVTPWGDFALFRIGEEFFAVQSFCPHLSGPLFQGTISGESVSCPWHLWRFSLRTGERLDRGGPRLERLAVRVGPAGTLLVTPEPRS